MIRVISFRTVCFNIVQTFIHKIQEGHVGLGRHILGLLNRIFYFLPSFGLGLSGLSFCLEAGFRVPGSVQDEVVPPSLAFDQIYTHRDPPLMGKIENLRASCRRESSSFYTPSWYFFSDKRRPPRGSLWQFQNLCQFFLFPSQFQTNFSNGIRPVKARLCGLVLKTTFTGYRNSSFSIALYSYFTNGQP